MKKIAVIGVPGGWSSQALVDRVQRRGHKGWLVDLETVVLDLHEFRLFNHEVELGEMDAIVVKKAGPFYSPHLLDRLEMLRLLHLRGVHVFSDPLHILRTLDRVSCTVTLRSGNIPMPPTAITENPERARDFVAHYKRAIFKPLYSTKARGMAVIEDGPETMQRILDFKAAGNDVMYLQQMVSHPGRDMGVAFLGGRYLGTYARKGASESWNTTTRSGGKYEPLEPSREIKDLAYKAQELFHLDFTCVDVVESPEGPMVFEVSAFGGFGGLREAHGIDAADLYVEYVLARIGA